MAKIRYDNLGNVLRKGEGQRKDDGRYTYDYVDAITKKRHFVTEWSLERLRLIEEQIQREQRWKKGEFIPEFVTLNDMFERSLALNRRILDETREQYKYNYNLYVRNTLGNIPVVDINYSDVLEFYGYLYEERELSKSTIKQVHTLVNQSFKMALKDRIIGYNPAEDAFVDLGLPEGKQKRVSLSVEQEVAFLEYVYRSKKYMRYYPVFFVLFWTGMRVGELTALCWKDIDFDKMEISVQKSYKNKLKDALTGKRNREVSNTKTYKSERIIPMMPEVAAAIKLEKRFQKITKKKNLSTMNGYRGFVFCNEIGNMLTGANLNDRIKRICKNYNSLERQRAKEEHREPQLLPSFTCHFARHTFCTRLCECSPNLTSIKDIMGHTKIETTMGYVHTTERECSQEVMCAVAQKYGKM